MFKNKTTRIVAFIGSLGASAALIGTAASTTGAYFTDSQAGNISGQSGHLKINKASDYDLKWTDLMPGTYEDKDVYYSTDVSKGTEDVWLVFDQTNAGYKAFTGGGSGQYDSGLGRYAHFAVKDDAGNLLFSSWNLRNKSDETSGCADANGHGANNPPTSESDTQNGNCGVPKYMLLQSDVANGSTKKFTMTFGLTGKAKGQNVQWANLPFSVVATQHGIRPDAGNF